MSIANNLVQIRQKISDAAKKANRNPEEIHLIAVSKTQSVEKILEAIHCGQMDFGENYLQEALPKIEKLQNLYSQQLDLKSIQWHFIGHIQRNKCKAIAEHFSWVHTIDSEVIAKRLNQYRAPLTTPLQVCIQINIGNEESKSGIKPEELLPLAKQIQALPFLKLRGLMAIPPATTDFETQKNYFQQLNYLLKQLQQHHFEVDTLSMGMSNDYVAAIEEGATHIRIGTAIFGERRK